MEEKIFLILCLVIATQLESTRSDCVVGGFNFDATFPETTYSNLKTENECKDKCRSVPNCIIWQWQPYKRKCWLMYVKAKLDSNSIFGINNCERGKPAEDAPICTVTKGDRNNVVTEHKNQTMEECKAKCSHDCLIWQYMRNTNLCRIHKLEVNPRAYSQVGIHYCSSGTTGTTCPGTCGVSNNQRSIEVSRIVGGNIPFITAQYPWMALLSVDKNGKPETAQPICGGTLISASSVLTAAHCVDDFKPEQLFVQVNVVSMKWAQKHKKLEVLAKIEHPLYISHAGMVTGNDIAVLNLKKSIRNPKTVCLPPPGDFYGTVFENMESIAIGYGASTIDKGPIEMQDLHEVKVDTMSNAECQRKYGSAREIIQSSLGLEWKQFPHCDQICTIGKEKNQGTCKGDSGGPLLFEVSKRKYVQIGVLAGGLVAPCNDDKATYGPDVFTRVSMHIDFIKKYAKDLPCDR